MKYKYIVRVEGHSDILYFEVDTYGKACAKAQSSLLENNNNKVSIYEHSLVMEMEPVFSIHA